MNCLICGKISEDYLCLNEDIHGATLIGCKERRARARNKLGERTVLGVCIDVRSTKTGSLERPEHEQISDILLLREILDTWVVQESPRWAHFDECVRSLILAALNEKSWKCAP